MKRFFSSGPAGRTGLTLGVALLATASLERAAAQYPADFTWHNTTLRGDNFQSHNQKIVWTANGLFRSGQLQDGDYWHEIVERSTDGGATWTPIWDVGKNITAPTIEADSNNNVYVIYPDSSSKTRFLKFSASNNYSPGSPVVNKTANQGSAAKFASFYDPGRDRIYHATQWGHLLTFDTSGNVVSAKQLFKTGSTGSRPSYPHLFVDESGVLHYALTVADAGDDVPYETIRYLKSLDGGETWKAMNGTSISIPTTSNPNGPSTMINLPGEENYQTWLAAMHVRNGKAHFAYKVRNPSKPSGAGNPPAITEHVHYMRFDVATGVREIDSSPNGEGWRGDALKVTDYLGFLRLRPGPPNRSALRGRQGRQSAQRPDQLRRRNHLARLRPFRLVQHVHESRALPPGYAGWQGRRLLRHQQPRSGRR